MDQLELSIYIYVLSIINLFFNYLENYLSISLISLSLKQIICYRLSEIDGSIRTFNIYMFFQLLSLLFSIILESIYLSHSSHSHTKRIIFFSSHSHSLQPRLQCTVSPKSKSISSGKKFF